MNANKKLIDKYLFSNLSILKREKKAIKEIKELSLNACKLYKEVLRNDLTFYDTFIFNSESFLNYYSNFNGATVCRFVTHVISTNKNNYCFHNAKRQIIFDIIYFCKSIKMKNFSQKDYEYIYNDFIYNCHNCFLDYTGLIDLSVCNFLESKKEKLSIFNIFDIPYQKVNQLSEVKKAVKDTLLNLNCKAELPNIDNICQIVIKSYNLHLNPNKYLQQIFENVFSKYFLDFNEINFFLNKINY